METAVREMIPGDPTYLYKLTEKLWDHQHQAVRECAFRDEFGLFFEMGAGKTATAISILRLWCLQQNKIPNTLVLCPPVVIEQWQEEFYKWSKLGPCTVPLIGTGKKRESILKDDMAKRKKAGSIYITNYETLLMKGVFSSLVEANVQVGIFDESHKLKNPGAKRTKAAISLADKMQQKLILTGTPILNSPMDIFSQFRIMDAGKSFGENFHVFKAKYFFDANVHLRGTQKYFPNYKPRKNIEEEFNRIIKLKSSRVKKEDCMDLPPLVRKKIPVEMSPEQKRIYKELKTELVAYLEGGAVVAQMALTKMLRLQQIVSGFVTYETEDGKKELKIFDKVPRLSQLEEMLQELTPDNKVIVWAVFKQNYQMIREVCEKNKIGYVEIHGELSAKKKQENIKAFRSDAEVRVVIGNPKAAGIGVNLVEAAYSTVYSRTHSLEDELQGEARNRRGGSEIHSKITRCDLYTPKTVDELIMEALVRKENLAEKILDMKKEIREN